MNRVTDRKLGAMIGMAVGDALGAAVEFRARGTFEPVTGYRGGGPHPINEGDWTDDTSMALAIADSIANRSGFLIKDDVMLRFCDWYVNGVYSVNGRCFDIGCQTRTAISAYQRTGTFDDIPAGDRSSGNGSIMRLAPIPAFGFDDPFDMRNAARDSSATTHPSQLCQDSCEVMAAIMDSLIHDAGLPPDSAVWLDALIDEGDFDARLIERVRRATGNANVKGGGFVLDCLEAALHAVTTRHSFKAATLFAVNLGGDSDTDGAVAGQIAGAHYGLSGIPKQLIDGLGRKDLLGKACLQVCGVNPFA